LDRDLPRLQSIKRWTTTRTGIIIHTITKTNGRNKTRDDLLKDKPSIPKKLRLKGWMSSVFSNENTLTPINSAVKAFVIKKPANTRKSRYELLHMKRATVSENTIDYLFTKPKERIKRQFLK